MWRAFRRIIQRPTGRLVAYVLQALCNNDVTATKTTELATACALHAISGAMKGCPETLSKTGISSKKRKTNLACVGISGKLAAIVGNHVNMDPAERISSHLQRCVRIVSTISNK